MLCMSYELPNSVLPTWEVSPLLLKNGRISFWQVLNNFDTIKFSLEISFPSDFPKPFNHLTPSSPAQILANFPGSYGDALTSPSAHKWSGHPCSENDKCTPLFLLTPCNYAYSCPLLFPLLPPEVWFSRKWTEPEIRMGARSWLC